MKRTRNGEQGMSLVEVTIILMVLAIVTAVAAPSIGDYLDDARGVKAKEDVEAIGVGIARLLRDTGAPFLLEDGDVAIATRHVKNNRVDLAVSDGMEPLVVASVTESTNANLQGTTGWSTDLSAAAPTAGTGGVQSLYDQLVSNDAQYVSPTTDLDTFDPGSPKSLGAFGKGWRGAYLSGVVSPDPWGNRYACNTAFLGTATDSTTAGNGSPVSGWEFDTFCVSAGRDGLLQTDFAATNGGLTLSISSNDGGADDVIYIVSGFGR